MGSKADMLLGFDELFDCPIEGRAHAVDQIVSALRKTNARFVSPNVGRVNCLAFCVAVIVFGQVGTFVLCYCDAVIEEQVIILVQLLYRLPYMLLPCYLVLLAVLLGVEHDGFVVCFVRSGAGHQNWCYFFCGGVVRN